MTTLNGHKEITMNINTAEFKAKCLQLMNQVAETHEPLIISKRGKPLVKRVPMDMEAPASQYGCMQGTVTFLGDIMSPIDETWSAERGEQLSEQQSQRSP